MYKIAAGFNPGFLESAGNIRVPESIELIELGLNEAFLFKSPCPVSIHLARSPISEGTEAQASYLGHLKDKLQILTQDKHLEIKSVGFHLAGPRSQGLGRFGMTSHFDAQPETMANCRRFLAEARDRLDIDIWIENANFYSHAPTDILRSWEATQDLSRQTGSALILDLAHILIDCRNAGLDWGLVLGGTDFSLVKEFHLSGIKVGHDGTWHDGHGQHIHETVWHCLRQILDLHFIDDQRDVYFNLEHTDPRWTSQSGAYYDDFRTLREMIASPKCPKQSRTYDLNQFARGNLERVLLLQIPGLSTYLEKRHLRLRDSVDAWLDVTLKDPAVRLVLDPHEVETGPQTLAIFAADSFIDYLRRAP